MCSQAARVDSHCHSFSRFWVVPLAPGLSGQVPGFLGPGSGSAVSPFFSDGPYSVYGTTPLLHAPRVWCAGRQIILSTLELDF